MLRSPLRTGWRKRPPHQPGLFKAGEPLRQDARADAIKARAKVAEPLRTQEQLPNDQERPPLAAHFARSRQCTELRVTESRHVPSRYCMKKILSRPFLEFDST